MIAAAKELEKGLQRALPSHHIAGRQVQQQQIFIMQL